MDDWNLSGIVVLSYLEGNNMRSVTLRAPARRGYFSERRARRSTRRLAQFDALEERQLLSVGQGNPSVPVVLHAAPASAVVAPANPSVIATSSQSSVASEFAGSSSTSSGQLGFLVGQFALPSGNSQSAGILATTAALTTNPQANLLGTNVTLTNLSVSVLNPQMTSTADAIIDDQVDSDAFLVPTTTEMLEQELGERTPTPMTLWNTQALIITSQNQNQAPPPAGLGSAAARPVSKKLGQSLNALPDVNPHGPARADFSEPPPAATTGQGSPAQPLQQPGQAPAQPGAMPQPGADNRGQSQPEIKKVLPPAPNPDQAAPQGTKPEQKPGGGQAPAPGAAPGTPAPPALNPDGSPVRGRSSDTESPKMLSVVIGPAVLVAGGHQLVLRAKDWSQGRFVPRWFGAERPLRRKSTPS
jgi:hypothetical protein